LFGLDGSLEQGRTMAFAVLGFAQLVHSLNIHSPHDSVFKTMLKNKSLLQAIAINAVMMLGVLLVPQIQNIFSLVALSATQWLLIALLAMMPWPIVEVMKLLKFNGRD
jgi:Ca2+-transporting ATPase